MRPEILYPLFKPVTVLKGVGPRLGQLIERLSGKNLVDLCWHLPTGLIDRRFRPKVAAAPDGAVATLTITVDEHHPPPSRRLPYKVLCSDETGSVSLVFFNAEADYLEKTLPLGTKRLISGQIGHYGAEIQMPHPNHILPPDRAAELPAVEAIYPLTTGLTAKPLHRAVRGALDQAPELREWQDPAWLEKNNWPSWRGALISAHSPDCQAAMEAEDPNRRRLAYDELLANQLALALIRHAARRRAGRIISGDGSLRRKLAAALPYALTEGQQDVLHDIQSDMAKPMRMLRLLQGDVGSGKTVVALTAMLAAVESRGQAAFMVPTEILARQHLETLTTFCRDLPIRIQILTGRNKGRPRQAILEDLAQGRIDIMIGTHALFTEDVVFKDLALTVIDEQHRFGVHQRLNLGDKGAAA
ncbi:MAG: DEAD/DEAH box helicase, partial [Alphaproteobacteria bacterium]|nr:DEAD/DEAH box helicase [Alphaproteobacteria bacterium]